MTTAGPDTGSGRTSRVRTGFTGRLLAGALAAVTALAFFVTVAPGASAATGSAAATLASANVGKSAGSCAVNPTTNTLGGSQFGTSCAGNGGQGEYWCADFARWVWGNVGFDTSGLTAAAGSFYLYGANHGMLHTSSTYVPQVGDAVVYDYQGGGYADHVGIVTAVNSDGTVDTANGDFGGQSGGTQSQFARTSSVVSDRLAAASSRVGAEPSNIGMTISAYVSPSGTGSTPPSTGDNPYTPTQVCGSGYTVVDSHTLTGAVVYLLYDSATGNNCVTTLAVSDLGKVAMNATLAVQGGTSAGDPGSYEWFAGPVALAAPTQCVKWGGTYQSSTWTSDWSHCT
jgi:hypothetical protein